MFCRKAYILKGICLLAVLIFVSSFMLSDMLNIKLTDASVPGLPAPTEVLGARGDYQAPLLRGIKVNYDDPLSFKFIFDTADEKDILPQDARRLINYFLATLAVPNESLWVNLSPYEQDRIVEDSLGETELGRDLLAQDYVLKQFSSSLTHPDTPTGRAYWGIENGLNLISTERNAFSKIWITPDPGSLEVQEGNGLVWIAEAGLLAQSERDYIAQKIENQKSKIHGTADAGFNLLLPAVTNELNQGRNFTELRQIYYAMILAMWFKKRFRESFYAAYLDKENVNGIDVEDKSVKNRIFALYKKSFERGVYDELSSSGCKVKGVRGKVQKRRFFSGGFTADAVLGEDGEIDIVASALTGNLAKTSSGRLKEYDLSLKSTAVSSGMVWLKSAVFSLFLAVFPGKLTADQVTGLVFTAGETECIYGEDDVIFEREDAVSMMKDQISVIKAAMRQSNDPRMREKAGNFNFLRVRAESVNGQMKIARIWFEGVPSDYIDINWQVNPAKEQRSAAPAVKSGGKVVNGMSYVKGRADESQFAGGTLYLEDDTDFDSYREQIAGVKKVMGAVKDRRINQYASKDPLRIMVDSNGNVIRLWFPGAEYYPDYIDVEWKAAQAGPDSQKAVNAAVAAAKAVSVPAAAPAAKQDTKVDEDMTYVKGSAAESQFAGGTIYLEDDKGFDGYLKQIEHIKKIMANAGDERIKQYASKDPLRIMVDGNGNVIRLWFPGAKHYPDYIDIGFSAGTVSQTSGAGGHSAASLAGNSTERVVVYKRDDVGQSDLRMRVVALYNLYGAPLPEGVEFTGDGDFINDILSVETVGGNIVKVVFKPIRGAGRRKIESLVNEKLLFQVAEEKEKAALAQRQLAALTTSLQNAAGPYVHIETSNILTQQEKDAIIAYLDSNASIQKHFSHPFEAVSAVPIFGTDQKKINFAFKRPSGEKDVPDEEVYKGYIMLEKGADGRLTVSHYIFDTVLFDTGSSAMGGSDSVGGVSMVDLEDDLDSALVVADSGRKMFASSSLANDIFANGIKYTITFSRFVTEEYVLALGL